jgi:hypothetical protein
MEKQNFGIAAADWLPTAELVSPGGRMTTSQMPAAIQEYFKHFRDVHVTVKNVFTSTDESKVAIEWDWDVTRIRDGVRKCPMTRSSSSCAGEDRLLARIFRSR